jgi:hypothetical protein
VAQFYIFKSRTSCQWVANVWIYSKYTTSDVVGIDLSLIQPATIPPNLSFRQRDIESPWHDLGVDSWDLIHMRMLNGSISNWPDTYHKIFR